MREQTTALETRLRNDPFIENAARTEWTKLCRSISLGAAGQGMPNLWLEVRPTHAIAAQPKIDSNAVTLDAAAKETQSEDTGKRMQAYGFDVRAVRILGKQELGHFHLYA